MNRGLTSGILLSLAAHLLIVFLLPGLSRPVADKMNYIEIEFIQRKETLSLKRVKKVQVKKTGTELKPLFERAELLGSKRMLQSFIEAELPPLLSKEKEQVKIEEMPLPGQERMLEGFLDKTEDFEKGIPLQDDFPKEAKKLPAEMFSEKEAYKKELLLKEIREEALEKKSKAAYEIRGPVSKRRTVVFKPPLPRSAKAEGEIELKFWVLADGMIGRIIPLKRGDPLLEEEAIRYLKKWRFNSLTNDREEEWGIIPIRFVLK
jgi:TonB family protein